MARIILVLGKSGTGKSSSLRNLPNTETYIIAPNGKPLPFAGSKKKYILGTNLKRTNDLLEIPKTVMSVNKAPSYKYLVIDDYSHFFTARTLNPAFMAQNSGNAAFARWNKFGSDVFNSFWSFADDLREDLTIIVMNHSEMKQDGQIGSKSSGGLLDKEIDISSHTTYTLHTQVLDTDDLTQKYKFMTNTDGLHLAKTPAGCIEDQLVDNDIFAIIKQIERYENGE